MKWVVVIYCPKGDHVGQSLPSRGGTIKQIIHILLMIESYLSIDIHFLILLIGNTNKIQTILQYSVTFELLCQILL